jgi:hypothetical protein
MERIHVTGLGPRTGTTLMAESMIACFAMDAFDDHEAHVFKLRRNCAVYISKWPGAMLSVRRRLRFDRHFHVICMVRDPRDVVTSRHGRDMVRYWAPRHGRDMVRYWAPLRLWKRNYRLAKPLFKHARVMPVRYEDLVTDPDKVRAEIARRLPFLRRTGGFSDFHRLANPAAGAVTALGGVRAFSTDSIGNWRRHLPRLVGQFAQQGPVTAELVELGYETDDAWLAALDGIEPDMTPSHWPDVRTRSLGQRAGDLRTGAWNYTRLAIGALERLAGRTIG